MSRAPKAMKENCVHYNNNCPYGANPEIYPRNCGSLLCKDFTSIDSRIGRNTMTKSSSDLQQLALSALQMSRDGPVTKEEMALRGIGYAILALLQFLRESDKPQVTNNCYNGCDCCNTISEM